MNTHPDLIAPPHAVGLEKSVLSSILQDAVEFLPRATEAGITAASFYLPQHQKLFDQIADTSARGDAVDLVVLTQKLLDAGRLDEIGGPSYITEIYTYAPAPVYFAPHCRELRDKQSLRELIAIAGRIAAEAAGIPEDVSQLIDEAETSIMALRDGRTSERPETVRETLAAVMRDYQSRWSGNAAARGIPTGYKDLDAMTGGLRPGELFVIGARPSVGKTALMMNIVEHLAIDQTVPSVVFSLEMARRQLIERMIAGRARHNIGNGEQMPPKPALPRIHRAVQSIEKAPLVIDDRSAITIAQLRASARRYIRTHGARVVLVDYLQLLRSRSRQADGSREREVAEISAGLKALAKEHGVSVVVLAQLNREIEKRSGGKSADPRMSDLKDSGSIEADADVIGLLHRASYQSQDPDAPATAELIIAKNRNGPTGGVPLTFIAEIMRFESGSPAAPPPPAPKRRRSRFEE